MPLLAPDGKAVESLQKKLEDLDKEIEAVARRKLITIVGSNIGHLAKLGVSDKVIYVEPFDLRGKDPEELVEVIRHFVIETKIENDISYHRTGSEPTGEFKKRYELDPHLIGPFGPTYKIDTTTKPGEKEFQDFMRILDTHTDRLGVAPEPIPYHSDVSNEGMADLRNVTITQANVPVAKLENYKPLENLKKRREALVKQIESKGGR